MVEIEGLLSADNGEINCSRWCESCRDMLDAKKIKVEPPVCSLLCKLP